MKTSVLVTGGAGFIGSHLVDLLLSSGFEVHVIDNFKTGHMKNIEHHKSNGDLIVYDIDLAYDSHKRQAEVFREFSDKLVFIVHLAAMADITPSVRSPKEYYENNLLSTLNILELARKCPNLKKFVYAASSSCYGDMPGYPTKETAQVNPKYPYALTKYLGEETVKHWAQLYRIPAVSLRFFNVYGPRARSGNSYGAVLGVFLAQKLANKPLTIVGDGEQRRDFVYVKDVVRAIQMSFKLSSFWDVFNVGTGAPQTVNHLADIIGGERVTIPKRPGEPDRTHADISKIKEELGWRPEFSFERGVQETLSFIGEWRDAPIWEPEAIEDETKDWFKYLGKD